MNAIVRIAGRQYRVSPGATLKVDRLPVAEGGAHVAEDVMMVEDNGSAQFGQPTLPYRVELEVLAQARHPRVLSYHFKRRGGRRRLQGHRQPYSLVRVKSITKGESSGS